MLLGIAITIAGISIAWWQWERRRVEQAKLWPSTEATIQSGDVEDVHGSTSEGPIQLPVFAFSYAVRGEYYSGRFALLRYTVDPGEPAIPRIIGQKLTVNYNPSHPEEWFIPEEMFGGWRVKQKRGPHVIGLYPRD